MIEEILLLSGVLFWIYAAWWFSYEVMLERELRRKQK